MSLQDILSFLFGQQEQTQQFQNFTPEQQSALEQLLTQGLGNFNYQGLENQARQDFQTKTVPMLAERFSSLGSGAQRSSAFANALGSAGSQLESNLAGLKANIGQQQLGFGLKPRFENAYFPRQAGFLENLLSAGAQGLGKAAGGAAAFL